MSREPLGAYVHKNRASAPTFFDGFVGGCRLNQREDRLHWAPQHTGFQCAVQPLDRQQPLGLLQKIDEHDVDGNCFEQQRVKWKSRGHV